MKKYILLILTLIFLLSMVGCNSNDANSDYPAAIMVEDSLYHLTQEAAPMEVDESAIIGYTKSYTNKYQKKTTKQISIEN